jgi:hypothetical protein
MWQIYNRFDFLNIYCKAHKGMKHAADTTYSSKEWWSSKSKSSIYRARVTPLTLWYTLDSRPPVATENLIHINSMRSTVSSTHTIESVIYDGICFNFQSPATKGTITCANFIGFAVPFSIVIDRVWMRRDTRPPWNCCRTDALGNFRLTPLRPLKTPRPQMPNWIPVPFNWFREHNIMNPDVDRERT